MEINIKTEDQQVAGILTALKINLTGENQKEWEDVLRTLLVFNNPKHTADLLIKRGVGLNTRPRPEFPLYEMVVDGKEKYLPFREAYVVFDSGFVPVDTGKFVLEFEHQRDFKLRPMTGEDKRKISDAADEYSART